MGLSVGWLRGWYLRAAAGQLYLRAHAGWPDMRVLLRNRRTKRYYAGPNQLEGEDERGVDFGSVRSAAKFAFEEKLVDIEIILRYDTCGGEIALPVLAEWCLFEERALRPAGFLWSPPLGRP